jgi:hypothetical protein
MSAFQRSGGFGKTYPPPTLRLEAGEICGGILGLIVLCSDERFRLAVLCNGKMAVFIFSTRHIIVVFDKENKK